MRFRTRLRLSATKTVAAVALAALLFGSACSLVHKQVATEKLRNTSLSLARVGEAVGYSSEAAFSRAFKKSLGAAPATWRQANG